MLAFTSVYFFESSLFNGLQAFGIKNFGPYLQLASQVAANPSLALSSAPATSRILSSEIYSMIFCYTQGIVSAPTANGRNAISWTDSINVRFAQMAANSGLPR
jgi:hypothetical protein